MRLGTQLGLRLLSCVTLLPCAYLAGMRILLQMPRVPLLGLLLATLEWG